jgi:hypothetical protein
MQAVSKKPGLSVVERNISVSCSKVVTEYRGDGDGSGTGGMARCIAQICSSTSACAGFMCDWMQ